MSEETVISKPTPRNADRASRRTVVLLTLCCALVLVAVGQRIFLRMHHRDPLDVKLHGNFEDATSALDEIWDKTPTNQQMALLLKLKQDESPGLRYAATDALERERGPDVADALEQSYRDSSSIVRRRAVEVLPSIDRERGLRMLLAGLRDEDDWVRDSAIGKLVMLAGRPNTGVDKRAVPMLMKTLDDPDQNVPFLAISALKKLTGQNWRYPIKGTTAEKQAMIASCRSWWAQHQATWPAVADLNDVPPIRPTRIDPAPDFSLRDVDGNWISLKSQKGRITLINFWGTWCGPCRKEVPDLIRLSHDMQGRNVEIIGIAHAEKMDPAEFKKWCQKNEVTYRQAFSTPEVMDNFNNIEEIPVSVLIDGKGRLRYRWDGDRDYDTFRAAIERLLNEEATQP
ncbi:MAG TPA: HEAT repeat domain-containing protein [Chthonomonadaceae bacterium]|nr:HEAT repeat domain-containing protein [Chthonomonadaceae bacterium]